MTEMQRWEPEIEEDDNILDEVEFLAKNENMTLEEASVSLPEYKSVAEGYLDYLIKQKESGALKK